MNQTFFHSTLTQSNTRLSAGNNAAHCLLDKNEQSMDVAEEMKSVVLSELIDYAWNRYPSAEISDIERSVAGYCGLHHENIVLGPGSASIITTLLNYFAISRKRIIINQPSYSLFDYHCRTYGIPYEPWTLNNDLDFDINDMPKPDAGSVVIITSPNNPVGNVMEPGLLRQLLEQYHDTLFLVDAVYCEFGNYDYTTWVNEYPNLMVLRSFSKAFPLAGLRLGYLCAQAGMAVQVKKLMLPFAISLLTIAFAKQVLFQPRFMQTARKAVMEIINERERMHRFINMYFGQQFVSVASQGNFLLVRCADKILFGLVMKGLNAAVIKVLSLDSAPLLANCFRVSIGSVDENNFFLETLVGLS